MRNKLGHLGGAYRGRSHHQSLKYEEIWLNDYDDPIEARKAVEAYRRRYAYERPHQALDYDVPANLYIPEETDGTLRVTA